MKLPAYFTTVTPLSKILTAILFITLPFIGFYLGSYYQDKLNLQPLNKQTINLDSKQANNKTQRCNKDSSLIGVSEYEFNTCLLTFPLEGYKMNGYIMVYPDNWEVKPRGAAGVNLFFGKKPFNNDLKDTLVFMSSTVTNLPLERADQETQFGAHENFFPTPTIDPNRKIISRKIELIGDKKVLHLVVENDAIPHHFFYFYYHKKTDENMYMSYVISANNPDEELQQNIYSMIKSLRFIER